jgi:hypothetical protein
MFDIINTLDKWNRVFRNQISFEIKFQTQIINNFNSTVSLFDETIQI